jgi:hypothetical protein
MLEESGRGKAMEPVSFPDRKGLQGLRIIQRTGDSLSFDRQSRKDGGMRP